MSMCEYVCVLLFLWCQHWRFNWLEWWTNLVHLCWACATGKSMNLYVYIYFLNWKDVTRSQYGWWNIQGSTFKIQRSENHNPLWCKPLSGMDDKLSPTMCYHGPLPGLISCTGLIMRVGFTCNTDGWPSSQSNSLAHFCIHVQAHRISPTHKPSPAHIHVHVQYKWSCVEYMHTSMMCCAHIVWGSGTRNWMAHLLQHYYDDVSTCPLFLHSTDQPYPLLWTTGNHMTSTLVPWSPQDTSPSHSRCVHDCLYRDICPLTCWVVVCVCV